MRHLFLAASLALAAMPALATEESTGTKEGDAVSTAPWPAAKANEWYAKQPWLVGANYGPATAINQLEMWQADTFDLATIDKELGWAKSLGFTSMRVFLHDLLWVNDKEGYLKRIEQ